MLRAKSRQSRHSTLRLRRGSKAAQQPMAAVLPDTVPVHPAHLDVCVSECAAASALAMHPSAVYVHTVGDLNRPFAALPALPRSTGT